MNDADIRVVKSKQAIKDAVFSIMGEKPINKITVTEVSEKAHINRKTFYSHFETVEDVVKEVEDEILSNIESFLQICIIEEYGFDPCYFLQFINNIYSSNPEFFENLVSQRNYHFFADKIKQMLIEYILSSVSIPEEHAYKVSFQVEFYISGAMALYIDWIKKQKPCPFEEVFELLMASVSSVLPMNHSPQTL